MRDKVKQGQGEVLQQHKEGLYSLAEAFWLVAFIRVSKQHFTNLMLIEESIC